MASQAVYLPASSIFLARAVTRVLGQLKAPITNMKQVYLDHSHIVTAFSLNVQVPSLMNCNLLEF